MLHGLALCSGVGGIEQGISRATSGNFRVVCHVERSAYAASVLVARMEEKKLDQAPIWDDVTTFDGRPWRGIVDIITAGLPCQPYSKAGKQHANGDKRALWPEFIRIVREIEPSAIFIENVTLFLRHFEPAFTELQKLGFEFTPPVRASAISVGAPHKRRRVFIFASHPGRKRLQGICSTGTAPWAARRSGGGREAGWKIECGRLRATGAVGGPWQTESPVFRVDDGPASRVDELRVIGNAVMPLMAEAGFRQSIYFLNQDIAIQEPGET